MSEFDLELLDPATRDTIVISGLHFMRSITEAYGSDKGMMVWDKITETLGNDVKGAILFRLMTGDGECTVTVPGTNTRYSNTRSGNFVLYVSAVRTFTKYGLKEARDFCDMTESGATGRLTVPFIKKQEFLKALGEVGVTAI